MRRLVTTTAARAAAVVAIALLAHVVLDSLGAVRIPLPALLVGGFAILAVGHLIAAASPPAAIQARIGEGEISGYGYPDRPFVRARHWQERLDVAEHDADYFARVVLPELRQLAEERLRAAHNLDRHDHPDRARDLLGPRVWSLLYGGTGPPRRPTTGQLTAVLDDLESL